MWRVENLAAKKILEEVFMANDFENKLETSINKLNRNVNELLWTNIFHDAIKGCKWLDAENFSICLGRWAVGYNYFYVVFRVLNEFKPKKILEMGLGQSSRLIGQYVKTHEGCRHDIVEHDADFVKISQENFNFSSASKFNLVNITKTEFDISGGQKGIITTYDEQGFKNVVDGQKYDFISIDGPFGYDSHPLARIDIVNCLPQCLSESFCIVIDDYDRVGEKNTAAVMRDVLTQNKINFRDGVYSGSKDLYLLASANLKWLTTM